MSRALLARVVNAYLGLTADASRRWLPAAIRGTAPNVDPDGTDLAIWSWEDGGRPFAIVFVANQSKPAWYNWFRNEAARDQKIENSIRDRKRSLEMKQQRVQERRDFQHDLVEGDILYTTWGYDQTNVDFYQVVGIRNKSVIVRKVKSKTVVDRGPYTEVVPEPDRFTGPPMLKLVQPEGYIKVDDHLARKWGGKPVYQTGFGFGH